MRGLYLLTILLVVLFASSCADNIEQRSLRVAVEDDTEERGVRDVLNSLKTKVKGKYQSTKMSLKNLKIKLMAKYKAAKTNAKEAWSDIKIYNALRKGKDQDEILTKMGVKPSFVDSQGTKFYDPKDPLWQKFDKVYREAYPNGL